MRTFFLLAVSNLLFQTMAFAQLKPKHFWPATTEFSIKNFHLNFRESEGNIKDQLSFNECVEGNCDNGAGTWAWVYPKVVDFRPDGFVEMRFVIYKGRFSNDGKTFEGKHLTGSYFLDGSGAKNRDFYANNFKPRKIINLAEDTAKPMHESSYTVYEGEAIFDSSLYTASKGKISYLRKYIPHGTGADIDALENAGATSVKGKYEKGTLQLIHAVMKEELPAKSFTGRMDGQRNILAGKLEYKDGSVYEGFFRNSNYYGPGKLITPQGNILQGYWENGRLQDSSTVQLPTEIWDMSGNIEATMQEASIQLFGANTKGKYFGESKNGKPDGKGFYILDMNTWYAGSFSNGLPSGLGYYYQFTDDGKNSNAYYHSIRVYTGYFANGYLANGSQQLHRYQWPAYETDPRYDLGYQLYESRTQTGTFQNMRLQGCGEYRFINYRYSASTKIETGYFENGQLRGWGTVEQPGITTTGKLKKFTGYFPEKAMVSFRDERTDLLGLSGNTIIFGNSPEYFERYIKDLTQATKSLKKELEEIPLQMQSCPTIIITEKEKQEYLTKAYLMLASMENNLANQIKSGPPKVFTQAECAANSVGAIFEPMQIVRHAATGKEFIVLTYYCMTKTYSFYPFDMYISNFKGGYSNSIDKNVRVPLDVAVKDYKRIGNFHVCNKCNGGGNLQTWVSGGQQGGWEKWTDNVYYRRPSTAYSYRTTVACDNCNGKGWLMR